MAARDFESPFVERESWEDAHGEAVDDRAGGPQRESPFAPAQSFEHEPSPSPGYESGPTFEDTELVEGQVSQNWAAAGYARVSPTTGIPYRWICRIEVRDSRGRAAGSGSGVMVSDRHVLTAAHVIAAKAANPQQYTLEVRPALDYGREPFGSSTAEKARLAPGYPSDPNNADHDYGLITLNTALGRKAFSAIGNVKLAHWGSAQFLGKHTIRPGDPRVGLAVETAGYPGARGAGQEMWSSTGRVLTVGANTMWTQARATPGQSGSPVWVSSGDERGMIGILVRSTTRADSSQARRTTDPMIRQLADWIIADGDAPWMRESAGESEQQELEQDFEDLTSQDAALEAETRYATSDHDREAWTMEAPDSFEGEADEAEPPYDAREEEAEYSNPAARFLPRRIVTGEYEGETGPPSIAEETPQLPAGVPAFRHLIQGMKADARSNTWVIDGGNIELSPLNPGFVDASDALVTSTLHTKLAEVMVARPAIRKYLSGESVRTRKATGGDRIRVAVVDLTGARLIKPDFAGWGSPVAVDAASCAKVAALYAAFQLQHELEHVVRADPGITTVARLVGVMRKRWEHVPNAPDLGKLLDATANPPGLAFSTDVKWAVKNIIDHDNANNAARVLIEAVGFPYIASLMWQSGLRHPTRGGMWLTTSYSSSNRWDRPSLPPPGPHFGHTTTALSMATFFTLLAQGRLTSPTASAAMKTALTQASWFGQTLTSARIASKVGLLLRCVHKKPKLVRGKPVLGKDGQPVMECDAWEATHAHEAGLIENDPVRYVVAIMTVGVPDGVKVMKELVSEIDALVRANNP